MATVRRRRVWAGLAVVVLVMATGLAAAQDIRFFRLGTGTTGGTYFPVGGIIASAISGPPGSPPCDFGGSCGVPGLIAVAQASNGSVDNVKNIASGAIEAALTQADIAFYAYTGTEVFTEFGQVESLRVIANLYLELVHFVVPADSDATSIADLAGRRVALGEEGSGTLVVAESVLGTYGLSRDNLEPVFVKPDAAVDMLVDGELDAFVLVAGAPVRAIDDLARRLPVRLLPINNAPAETLIAELPYFTSAVIESGTYQGVPSVETIGVGALLAISAEVDAETVHGITAALWHPTTLGLLANGHPRGADIQLETALRGLAIPLHEGALRYYQEVGRIGSSNDGTVANSTDRPQQPAPPVDLDTPADMPDSP